MDREYKFELGSTVKDTITGFEGIVRVRSQYLTGCNTYGLQSKKLTKSGETAKWEYFDEALLSQVGKKVLLKERVPTGGPTSDNHNPPQR